MLVKSQNIFPIGKGNVRKKVPHEKLFEKSFEKQRMSVQVNLGSGIGFRRTHNIIEETNTFELVDNGRELSLFEDEYKKEIEKHLGLKSHNFFMFQNRLIKMTKNHLPQLFEELSGSAEFVEEFDQLKARKEECEQRVRDISL